MAKLGMFFKTLGTKIATLWKTTKWFKIASIGGAVVIATSAVVIPNAVISETGGIFHKCDYSVENVDAAYSYSAANCIEKAKYYYSCACGEKGSELFEYGDALGHDLTHHASKQVACTEIGYDDYDTCSRCDYTTYNEIPATGHTGGEWITDADATCTVDGSKHQVCFVCNDTIEIEVIPARHEESEWIIDISPTLTIKGQQHQECLICNIILRTEEIETLLSYKLKSDDTYEIIGYSKDFIYDELTIPQVYMGKKITSIGANAFNVCTQLEKVVWSNEIKSVHPLAFNGCSGLVESLPQYISEDLVIENTGKIYKANSTQIKNVATLIIKEGCVIIGGEIVNHGTIQAVGTSSSLVYFYNVDIPGMDDRGRGNIEFNNVLFINGKLLRHARDVDIEIIDSYLLNVDFASSSWYYPSFLIKDSILENCGDITIYSFSKDRPTIYNTQFIKCGSIINEGSGEMIVKNCVFIDPINYVFKLKYSAIISSVNNDFGTTDKNVIQDMIYDGNDDFYIDNTVIIS